MPAALLLFTACKKSSPGDGNGNGNGNGSGQLLKTFALVVYNPSSGGKLDSMTTDYSYDAQNRITSKILKTYDFSTNPSGDLTIDTATESYTSALITETRQLWKTGAHQQTITTTYHLNAAGKLADSSDQVTVDYVNPFNSSTNFSTYAYDGNGFLSNEKIYLLQNGQKNLVTEVNCTNSNGNTTSTSIAIYILSTAVTTKTDFGFSSQTPSSTMIASTGDPINNIVGIASNGINLMHNDANLVQSATVSVSGNVVETENITYTFDNQNRVSTITYKMDNGTLVSMAYYTY